MLTFNLLGGITPLPNSVPKAGQVSSRLRRLRREWLCCGVCGNSRLPPNDYFMTIPLPLAGSAEVDHIAKI